MKDEILEVGLIKLSLPLFLVDRSFATGIA